MYHLRAAIIDALMNLGVVETEALSVGRLALMIKRHTKEVMPLAEEGRKLATQERDLLEAIADTTRPWNERCNAANRLSNESPYLKWDYMAPVASGGKTVTVEITPEGRERLAYLRGLAGEEGVE